MATLSSVKEGYQSVISTVVKINSLTIEQMERMGGKQLDCARIYGEMAFNQLKATHNISSISDMKCFTGETVERTGNMAKQMLNDSKEWVELGTQYREQLVSIVKTVTTEEAETKSAGKTSAADYEVVPEKVKKPASNKESGGVTAGKKS